MASTAVYLIALALTLLILVVLWEGLSSRLDDLAMDHADTAPCEYVSPLESGRDDDEPA